MRKILTVLLILVSSTHVYSSEDYSWLKTSNPNELFVYANFDNCKELEIKGKEMIDTVLTLSRITYTLESYYVVSVIKGDELDSFLMPNAALDEKPFLYIVPMCAKSDSMYAYVINAYFAYLVEGTDVARLYSKPSGSIGGLGAMSRVEQVFKNNIERLLSKYIKANAATKK